MISYDHLLIFFCFQALLSGEMRDTVEINTAGAKILERFFSRNERATLFRSWAGAASMMLKGGNDMWGKL